MYKKITTSKSFKLLYGALALIFFLFILFLVTFLDKTTIIFTPEGSILSCIAVIILILVSVNLYRRKLIISKDAVYYENVWHSKKLTAEKIKGYRVTNRAIIIEPVDKAISKLYIKDYISLSENKIIIKSLSENFEDLDKLDLENNRQEIIQDTNWDLPTQEKKVKLNQSRKFATTYSIIAIVLSATSIFLHHWSFVISIILLIYILIGIFLIIYSKGFISFYARRNTGYNSIFIGLVFTSVVLIYQSFFNFEIMDYNMVFEPVIIVTVMLFIAMAIIMLWFKPEKLIIQFLFALMFSFVCSISIVSIINTDFDHSKPIIVKARVIGLTKNNCDLLIFEPGEFQFISVSASKSEFKTFALKSIVILNVKRGFLGIPWINSSE